MKLTALVGSSGTGKSYKAMSLARELGIDYLIDDGILINNQMKLIGSSAKREKTKVAAVKRAIFFWEEPRNEMIKVIKEKNPSELLIIGTSDKMVKKIAKNLDIEPIDKIVYIDDISTEEEIKLALYNRAHFGKHVIPLPTLEVRKDFSGYFLDRLKIFSRVFGRNDITIEKSVVRPTFSLMGDYLISNKTLIEIVARSVMLVDGIYKHSKIRVYEVINGIKLEVDIVINYGNNINVVSNKVLESIKNNFETMTQMNVVSIELSVKGLHVK